MDSIDTPTLHVDLKRSNALGITLRQIEAAAWVAEGNTDEETGTIIGCTGRTAKAHVLAAMRATGTHTRAQMVAKLFINQVFMSRVCIALMVCIAGGLSDGQADELLRVRTRINSARTHRIGRNRNAA